MKTAYEVLGLNRDATLIDIEHSYRHLLNAQGARSGDGRLSKEEQQRLRALREAYVVLSSPSQRLAYDRSLHAREQRRSRRIHALCMALAVSSLLGGLSLMGAGFTDLLQQDGDGQAARLPAAMQAAQRTRDGTADAHDAGRR